jgi:uncharacterized membrane protein YdjX (TVP38/TMEM64 family)
MRHKDRWLAGATLVALASLVTWSYVSGGIAHVLLSPDLTGPEKVQELQDFFLAWGSIAPLVYLLFVTVEVVVAPIPGTILYVPGGLIFGWKIGGIVTLAGNVLGATICCLIARSLGRPYAERFFKKESLAKYDTLLSKNAVWVILLLRVNPITSSDLVSYAAGLTSMAVWRVALGTLLGMAPLCFLQAYFAEELFTRFPALIYPLVVVCILYFVYVVYILARLKEGPPPSDKSRKNSSPPRPPRSLTRK